MFVVVYQYKVPIDKTNEYIKLEKQAIKIYLEYGCEDVQILRDAKKPNRWMEINRFQDLKTYQKVIKKMNEDPRIEILSARLKEIFAENEPQPEKNMYYRII